VKNISAFFNRKMFCRVLLLVFVASFLLDIQVESKAYAVTTMKVPTTSVNKASLVVKKPTQLRSSNYYICPLLVCNMRRVKGDSGQREKHLSQAVGPKNAV